MDLTDYSLEDLQELLLEVEKFDKYNKLYSVKPYDYQLEFMNASKHYHQRYIRSGNRCGKTQGCAIEFAMHVTGLYQPWFQGDRITDSGHIYWAIGLTFDSTANVLQKELFGTNDIRNDDALGTGTIPRDCIELKNVVKDGPNIRSIRIRHIDGGYNTVQFYAASLGHEKLMGAAVKLIWMDEEDRHSSMSIYSQSLTRTTTTNGHIMMSCTPEAGYTELNQRYDEDTTGHLYLKQVSMYDAPHLTEEIIEKLKAGWPEYEWDMRIYGLPVLGSGAVFPILDSQMECDSITPLAHWQVCAAVDWGSSVDPSVVVFCAYDPDNDIYYVYDEHVLNGEPGTYNDRSPESVARVIRNSGTPNIPIIVPHDSGLKSNKHGKGAQLVATGVNVDRTQFSNPYHLTMENVVAGQRKPIHNSIEVGLEEMRRLFSEGKLKVSRNCDVWFKEKRGYFYNKGVCVGEDHCIDASRYGILSLVGNKGIPYGQCFSSFTDFNNGFSGNSHSIDFDYNTRN